MSGPGAKCIAVAGLITRINYSLMTGNFELDFEGGEIRFRSIDAEGDRLSTALVRQLMFDVDYKNLSESLRNSETWGVV